MKAHQLHRLKHSQRHRLKHSRNRNNLRQW
jgi:hypothetical protein